MQTQSGNISIPQGQLTVQVTGLNLEVAPPGPMLTVIAPDGGPDFLFAFLVGPTTTDGFTIGLSAPPSVPGYSVQWDFSLNQTANIPSPNVVPILPGQLLIPITGLGLTSAPPTPTFSIIAPPNPPDSLFPYLAGPTTADGFVIGLNAPPSVAGYSLQWQFPSTQPKEEGSFTRPVPLLAYPWKDRSSLVAGRHAINGNSFCLTVDPYGLSFLVYPEVDDNHQIVINWDGVRNTFAPTDIVPFDEECAGVVAEYVGAYLARMKNDWSTWGAAMKPAIGSYYSKMRQLKLNAQARQQMREA